MLAGKLGVSLCYSSPTRWMGMPELTWEQVGTRGYAQLSWWRNAALLVNVRISERATRRDWKLPTS